MRRPRPPLPVKAKGVSSHAPQPERATVFAGSALDRPGRWQDSRKLEKKLRWAASVLRILATEAAKALVLIDAVQCPARLANCCLGSHQMVSVGLYRR